MRYQPTRQDVKAFAKALREAQGQCLNLKELEARRDAHLASLKA